MLRPPPRSTLFPYTTLFRSRTERRQTAVSNHPYTFRGDDNRLEVKATASLGANQTLIGSYQDRKSTRLNSSHSQISYAVFCLKKKKKRAATWKKESRPIYRA